MGDTTPFYDSVEEGIKALEGKCGFYVEITSVLGHLIHSGRGIVVVYEGRCYSAHIPSGLKTPWVNEYSVNLSEVPRKKISMLRGVVESEMSIVEKTILEALQGGSKLEEVTITLPVNIIPAKQT